MTRWPLWLAVLAACGTETGNPEEFALRYNARSSSDVAIGEGSGVVVTSVWLRLSDVELDPDCAGVDVDRLDALGFADHAGFDAASQVVTPTASSYCALRTALVVEPDPVAEPVDVAGASIGLVGTLSDGRPFSVAVDEDIDVVLELDDAPVPETGWLLSFDVGTWLDEEALEALPDDVVRVDAESHADLLDAFVGRLDAGIHLHVDADADGQVDDDEAQVDR